mgnify:FL=1
MSSQCAHCGAPLEDCPAVCVLCGAIQAPSVAVRHEPAQGVQPAATPFAPASASEDVALSGIGGWLILPAIALAFAPFINLVALFTNVHVLAGVQAGEYLASHPGLHIMIVFEAISNIVFFLYTIGLNALFFPKSKGFLTAMVVNLIVTLFVASIDSIGAEQTGLVGQSTQLMWAIVGAAIWIPYFLRSRRVAVTFVR